MKRSILFFLFVISTSIVKSQSYQQLVDSAAQMAQKAKDPGTERNALKLYEQAFALYPKELDNATRYDVSILAAKLAESDQAFKYLAPLAKDGFINNPGWEIITGINAATDYKNLLGDQRWKKLEQQARLDKKAFYHALMENQKEFQHHSPLSKKRLEKLKGKEVYEYLKNYNGFLNKKKRDYSIKFKISDTINTSYYVRLPKNYNPKKRYSLLFFLHGAVFSNALTDYQSDYVLGDWNRFYTKYADQNELIMVYPSGSKKYNWMTPDDGFFMIPAMLKEIKQSINIDDNKVFISGHSNGATGSFSYLMKQQSPFAGFYGFNTKPRVATGGTFIKNIMNRSFFNVSTDKDYYYHPDANDSLTMMMKRIGADYQDHRYNGFPHWFPEFDESEPAMQLLFKDLISRKRNPFPEKIYWECDDLKYGKADWLQVNQLDTLRPRADWHDRLNFDIFKQLVFGKNDSLIQRDTLLKAFRFPRKSAAVKGYYQHNEFHMESAAAGSFSIFISPEMVDMDKPVTIFVNGVKKMSRQPKYNKEFMLRNFNRDGDRKAIWIDEFKISD